jgi:hypothetical protein
MDIYSKTISLDTIDKIVDQEFKAGYGYFNKIVNLSTLLDLKVGNRQEIIGWFDSELKWGYCIVMSFSSCYHCYRRGVSICTCKAFVEES